MKDHLPPSDLLRALAEEDEDMEAADPRLPQVITLCADRDPTNRDWAVYLLAQSDADTPAVRAALTAALGDEDGSVRAEALVGLAQRVPDEARPHVIKELNGDDAYAPLFEAAALCGHPDLIKPLKTWLKTGDKELDALVKEALDACKGAG
ncbi:HEAT repeat domain-containing protein [Azospirillum sp. B4]|uniref:HEAT repeat domain-containing protein n=1 Tax=Azospirillum sp. B4 TaxID=95605 RepID=UPI00034AF20A|nr:HEAT repeat domain-containing protein [Azospirillum sp. B4]